MTLYRLQPATDRPWWFALFGVTTTVLLLPALLLPVVPTRAVSEQLILGAPDGWHIPLDMTCRPSGDILHTVWQCGDVTANTTYGESGTDPDLTLRRAMRALLLQAPPESAEIMREGQARMLIDEPARAVGMALEGTGGHAGMTITVVVTGPGHASAAFADTVWREFTGQGLPEVVREAIASLPGPAGPRDGLQIPFEPQVVPA